MGGWVGEAIGSQTVELGGAAVAQGQNEDFKRRGVRLEAGILETGS